MNLRELSEPARAKLLAGARTFALARSERAYMPGDTAANVYFVARGQIKIVRTAASGAESIVGIRNEGDIFGELSWLAGPDVERKTSAIALEPAEIVRLDAAQFARCITSDTELGAAFARGLARRLSAAESELTELAGKSVPGRLVDALGKLAGEHGIKESDGSIRIAIRLTHQDLADLIGTSRETLTKELSTLADLGLVRVTHRTVALVQPAAFPYATESV